MPSLKFTGSYIEAVIKEWQARKTELTEPIKTVYIGGGTPSSLLPENLRRLIDGLDIHEWAVHEFTIEANPEDVSPEWVKAIVSMGINRVSMGVQSLINEELYAIGRRHSAQQALDAIDVLHDNGIENLNCDLIYGLPGQTISSWKYSLEHLLNRQLAHLSAYILTYEHGTRLWARKNAGKIKEVSDDVIAQMYDILIDCTKNAGMDHYEISNFGLSGKHSQHNSNYWNYTPYLGLGVSAHSFDGMIRRYNPSNIKQYLQNPDASFVEESISNDSLHNDKVITSLRTSNGIDAAEFNEEERVMLSRYVQNGTMQAVDNNRYRISERGWLLADAIMTDFIRVD